jgi:TPR repeat protein
MGHKLLLAGLALLLSIFGSTAANAADERIALVIGASDYGPNAKLKNTIADAELMADTLRQVGFAEGNITILRNPDRAVMRRELTNFYNKARAIAGNGLALFYFAGHGVQIDGENYLLPIDPDIIESGGSEATIINRGVQPQMILDELTRTNIRNIALILDACRQNQFAKTQRGLVRVDLKEGTTGPKKLVAYATSYGSVAADGSGRNSPYTKELTEQLKVPGRPLLESIAAVTNLVANATANRQTPEIQGSGDLVLVPPTAFRFDTRDFGRSNSNADRASVSYEIIPFPRTPDRDAVTGLLKTGNKAFDQYLDMTYKYLETGTDFSIGRLLLDELIAESDRGVSESSDLLASYYRGMEFSKEVDKEKFLKFSRRAIAQGSALAIARHAQFLCCDADGPHDVEEAKLWLEADITSGNSSSMIVLATMYRDGLFGEKNFEESVRLYKKAIDSGNFNAIRNIADLYYFSDYGHVDLKIALKYYREYFSKGSGFAADKLGRLVRFGVESDHRDADPEEALNIFIAGTQNLCPYCWPEVAELLQSGALGTVDSRTVYAAYARGDQVNDSKSTLKMALMLSDGIGVEKDVAASTQKLLKAAELGNLEATFYAGNRLANGVGIAPDSARAALLLRTITALDRNPDPNKRFWLQQWMIMNAALRLAELIEDKKAAPVSASELVDLRARYGARNGKRVGFENVVDCAGRREVTRFDLFEWDRPNDETALDVAAEYEKFWGGCIVPPSDLADMKALKRQARETRSSFIDLVLKKYPLPKSTNPEPTAVQTPAKP